VALARHRPTEEPLRPRNDWVRAAHDLRLTHPLRRTLDRPAAWTFVPPPGAP